DQSATSPGITMMAWVKPTSTSAGTRYIFATNTNSNNNWGLYRNGANLYVVDGNGATDSTYDLTANIWQHVAVVFDPRLDGFNMYYNGVPIFTRSVLAYSTNDYNFTIGSDLGTSSSTAVFIGTIDQVMVFNRSLSTDQVYAIYQNRTNEWVDGDTSVRENWTVTVVPIDYYEDGISVSSNNVTILNTLPVVDSIILNATTTANNTNDNLTVYVTISDADGDVTNVSAYNWYMNGTSITLLNMPFSTKLNDTFYNNIYDYSGYNHQGVDAGQAYWDDTGGFDGKGAYYFDGTGDYINTTLNIDQSATSPGITMMAWVKPTSSSAGDN
ncbi:MAG: LamG domain-containing protein, partial [Nanoarchaeota archaeon]|nr:LamG domain-containing protein [Nanoarchaeota archaeon]